MYAIVEIAGHQFKVEKDQKVFVNRLSGEEGDQISFDRVLLTGNDKDITVGAPAIKGASVGATITRHLKGDKVIVFKKKRRQGYRRKNGHRQALTEIQIEGISLDGKSSAPAEKKAAKAEPSSKKENKATEEKTSKKENDSSDLSNHTVVELKELAKEKEIEGYSSMRKAELIEALSNA